MKIKCGPSSVERAEMIEAGTHPLQQWRKHFALFPIRVASKDCRWFEYVMVRYHRWNLWSESGWNAEYVSIEDYKHKPANEYYDEV